METAFTQAQENRLLELGAADEILEKKFESLEARGQAFQKIEKQLVKENKEHLEKLLNERRITALGDLQERLSKALREKGFTQVMTPTIVTAKALEKMTITRDNPLFEQVFWLDGKTCLRPMLAPNLYEVSKQLIGSQKLPLRIFEIGSCFRKESEGKRHLKEFTMLNLVEWGTPIEERVEAIKEFAGLVLEAAGIQDYEFLNEDSVVYGVGLDVVGSDGLELASTSMGPHPLDAAWKINCTWTGIGFGLERLLMYREKESGIHKYARSNVFLDGASLRVK